MAKLSNMAKYSQNGHIEQVLYGQTYKPSRMSMETAQNMWIVCENGTLIPIICKKLWPK